MQTRNLPFVVTLLLALLPVLHAAESGGEARLPARKAGLWQLKTSMDEGSGPVDQSMKLCIDERMEANTIAASMQQHKDNCTKYEIKPGAGTFLVDAECTFNKRKVVSTTAMSGDFQTSFEIKIDSTTTDPEAKEQTIAIKRAITQTGKYLGESCGELSPGEAEGPDGKRVLVQ